MNDLRVYPFFLEFNQIEKQQFYSLLKPVEFQEGSILHYQGDICESALLIINGKVRVYSQADDFSEEVTLYTLEAGEQCLVNIASVLGQAKTVGTAITDTYVKAYLINEKDIKMFMEHTPKYQHYIFSLYSKKLVELTQEIQRLKFQKLDERIMDFLHIHEENKILITHKELSHKMNTSRSVVSRVLKTLEQKKKILLHRGWIELL